jgi:hypothetical protein
MSQGYVLHVDQDIPIARVKPWQKAYEKQKAKYNPDKRSLKEKLTHVKASTEKTTVS